MQQQHVIDVLLERYCDLGAAGKLKPGIDDTCSEHPDLAGRPKSCTGALRSHPRWPATFSGYFCFMACQCLKNVMVGCYAGWEPVTGALNLASRQPKIEVVM